MDFSEKNKFAFSAPNIFSYPHLSGNLFSPSDLLSDVGMSGALRVMYALSISARCMYVWYMSARRMPRSTDGLSCPSDASRP